MSHVFRGGYVVREGEDTVDVIGLTTAEEVVCPRKICVGCAKVQKFGLGREKTCGCVYR